MKKKLLTFIFFAGLFASSKGQLIQGTIKKGVANNEIEVWLKPDFNNTTQFIAQMGLPIAWPVSAPRQPTSITVTLDPQFIADFGNNYSVIINPVAHNTANTENYFFIFLNRGGTGASNPQTWSIGTEFKVLTAAFNPNNTPGAQVKLADYQDGGSDGQGFFYTADGNANYYYTTNSIGNFYATAGQSTVGGNAAAGYSQTIAGISLPVSLSGLSGYRENNKNVLKWSTASEANNRGFDVQRSTDGVNYSSIGFVNTQAQNGNSNSLLHYSFNDNSPAGKKQFYRLQQEDFDGRTKQSNIVIIRGDKPLTLAIGGFFPNPAKDMLNVMIDAPAKDNVMVVINDMNGKLIKRQKVNVETGSNTIPIDIHEAGKGSYVLRVVSNENTVAGKFVVQ